MQFNSYSFLLLLIPAVALFWTLPPAARRWYVPALSVAYYSAWHSAFLAVPLLVCAAVYVAASAMARRPREARRWLWTGVAFILAIFFFFRYRVFVVRSLLSLAGAAPETAAFAAVPLGLSFYSFEAIGYLIDTSQGRIKNHHISKLFSFVMFLPT